MEGLLSTGPTPSSFYIFIIKKIKKIITLTKILVKVVELVGGGSVINGAYPV